MSGALQVALNRCRVGNCRDDLHLASANRAPFKLQTECSGQQRGPCQSVCARCRGLFAGGLLLSRCGRNDLVSVLGVRRKHTVVMHGIFPGRRYQGAQFLETCLSIRTKLCVKESCTAGTRCTERRCQSMSAQGRENMACCIATSRENPR